MKTTGWLVLLVCAMLLGAIVAGCSGTSGPGGGAGDRTIGGVAQYVGDGGGSLKPWPAMIPPPESPASLGTLLKFGDVPKTTTVPRKQTNWFRLPPIGAGKTIVVTLQPTADEDSDLYVMKGPAGPVLAYSNRTPTAGSDPLPTYGYVPDWAAFTPGNTHGWPAALIAAFGMPNGTATKHFWVESDIVSPLIVNGGGYSHAVQGGSSNWYSFPATAGKQYTVRLAQFVGKPDWFVYGDKSWKFKAQYISGGGGDAVFTATETTTHFVRVWGESPGANTYHVLARQP
jgi:hypothetical protein